MTSRNARFWVATLVVVQCLGLAYSAWMLANPTNQFRLLSALCGVTINSLFLPFNLYVWHSLRKD